MHSHTQSLNANYDAVTVYKENQAFPNRVDELVCGVCRLYLQEKLGRKQAKYEKADEEKLAMERQIAETLKMFQAQLQMQQEQLTAVKQTTVETASKANQLVLIGQQQQQQQVVVQQQQATPVSSCRSTGPLRALVLGNLNVGSLVRSWVIVAAWLCVVFFSDISVLRASLVSFVFDFDNSPSVHVYPSMRMRRPLKINARKQHM